MWDLTPWVKYRVGVLVVIGLIVMLVASFPLGLFFIATAALGWAYWRWLEARRER